MQFKGRDLDRRDLETKHTHIHTADADLFLQSQKFIGAYSAFLKRQGKLPIPGSSPTQLLHKPDRQY